MKDKQIREKESALIITKTNYKTCRPVNDRLNVKMEKYPTHVDGEDPGCLQMKRIHHHY